MFSVSKSQPLLCIVQIDPRKFKLLQRICTDGATDVNFLQLPRFLWMSLGSRCFVGLRVITALRGVIKFLVIMLLFNCIKAVVLKWLAFYFTLNDYCWLFWNWKSYSYKPFKQTAPLWITRHHLLSSFVFLRLPKIKQIHST